MYQIERDWITRAGLRAVVVVLLYQLGLRRHRCGYVEVPRGHPLYGVGYMEPCEVIPEDLTEQALLGKKSPVLLVTASVGAAAGKTLRRSPDVAFDVHGGLTYSGPGSDGYPVPSEGWWFGFDCAHAGDAPIDHLPYVSEVQAGGVTRSLDYVVSECERLADQIARAFPAMGS